MSQEVPKKKRKLKDFSDGDPQIRFTLMVISIIGGFLLWFLITLIPTINTFLASPKQVWAALLSESAANGRYFKDISISLQRVLIGFGLYIAFKTLAHVSSLTKQDAPKFLGELLTMGFKVMICYILLTNSKQIYDYEKNPTAWKYEGDLPAVIDFYATWCGPCKMMAPVMETLAGEYEGRVRIYKIDVDKEQRLAALFGVRSIPTFLFIPQSGDPQHAMGAMDITQMRRIIDEVLLKK